MKKQKLNLLLIHNEGTFANLTKQKLDDFFSIRAFHIRKNYPLKILENEIFNLLNKNKFNLLVYISGETRSYNYMKTLNFELPFFIAGICNKDRNVFGMMPHPERAADDSLRNKDGKLLFKSILDHIM